MHYDQAMTSAFFEHPILNSPYDYPARHWELDATGQPTQLVAERRREATFFSPIPKPKKRKAAARQDEMLFEDEAGLSTKQQQYERSQLINEVRNQVDTWRKLPESQWLVTPETARLLKHWRRHDISGVRPFFCQVEAAETAIWLTEVAQHNKAGSVLLQRLAVANQNANPELMRLALKLATGAGKTTVMAMLIAWQTLNAVRRPGSKHFTRGFLLVAPGLTIKDRLRVLQPHDPYSYYRERELVPNDLLGEMMSAKIVITNYHAFKLRERLELSAGGRAFLKGRTGQELQTLETEGQMIQRVMPDLMGLKSIMVLNDEAHHCYREKPPEPDDEELKGDEKQEAEHNAEAARLWISGLEAVNRKLGVTRIFDLSATPFFLSGSGYAEGTLFPWTMSDFSLMDAIECGIVKLPRVPVAENIPGDEMPLFRDLWKHIGKEMPKTGRSTGGKRDPMDLPQKLQTALEALYGHYAQTFELWHQRGIGVPPCFIIVCQNTAISKLVYDFVSGYLHENPDGTVTPMKGRLALFQNHDPVTMNPLPRPNTLLIDSEQLESGEKLDDNFRAMAADEIERFRSDVRERKRDIHAADNLSDQDLLREVMNTVGKSGQLGAQVRCVVSVSMLTEGWDANNVTHILGIRAFGTQLLCEQVIGRALRRQSYELNDEGQFNVEYADIFGVPFDFTAKPEVAPPQPPRETIQVKALRPERDHLVIRFPRVEGYRVELADERLTATFDEDSKFVLTPEMVGPTITTNAGIIGEVVDMNLAHLKDVRPSTVLYELTKHLVFNHWREHGESPPLNLFGQLKRIARQWLEECLECRGSTYPGLLMYRQLADEACNRITAGIVSTLDGTRPIKALLDPYNPTGSTAHVRFNTSRALRWDTRGPPPKNHVNWVILDSDWEAELCRIAEAHPKVLAYTKNHNLGLEVPYQYESTARRYLPDFIVLVDDGQGATDPLHLVVEVKGYRREDAKVKKKTINAYWIPGVNQLQTYGRWAFAEFTDMYEMEEDFNAKLAAEFNRVINTAAGGKASA